MLKILKNLKKVKLGKGTLMADAITEHIQSGNSDNINWTKLPDGTVIMQAMYSIDKDSSNLKTINLPISLVGSISQIYRNTSVSIGVTRGLNYNNSVAFNNSSVITGYDFTSGSQIRIQVEATPNLTDDRKRNVSLIVIGKYK